MVRFPSTDRFTVDHAQEIYGIARWSNGYLVIRENGNLAVSPTGDRRQAMDLIQVVEELKERGYRTPVLLRFPQLLKAQVRRLEKAFRSAMEEFEYSEPFRPVFPIKVNQQLPVVEGLLRHGSDVGMGLEVGSRPELLAAAAIPAPAGSLLVCNGFKDSDYLSSANLAQKLGRNVVVVIEKPFEIDDLIRIRDEEESLPNLGIRIKLQSRGSGLWEKSGGFASKFGLTTQQLLEVLERLKEAGLRDRIELLHFHIGSQVTEIRRIKNAVREAARVYCKLRKMGIGIRYLDVGGGLGIDYDGSRTSADASVNYNVQEYANDIVFHVKDVCDTEEVPLPTIVCESGRMLTAYHAMLITDVRGAIAGIDPDLPEIDEGAHEVIRELQEVARDISVKNYREYYHDAIEYRDRMYSLFNLGMLSLQDRARGETVLREIVKRVVRFARTARFMAEEFVDLEHRLHDKYICNFSVFQSLPDHWALDQLFPVVPIHRLDEYPNTHATLVDITCDSDGEVDRFIDLKDLKEALELHHLQDGEPYYLGFMLIGAYQDTMGDLHNLFGRVHEAVVSLDAEGGLAIDAVRRGDRAKDTLGSFGYEEATLVSFIEAGLRKRVEAGELDDGEAKELLEDYRQRLGHYTYLD